MANQYLKGQTVRITGTFTVSGTNTDPTTITLKVEDPSGNEASYTYALGEVTKSAAGIYYKDVVIDESGYWIYRWEGTGAVAAVDEEMIYGLGSVF
jgi:hypothetical protein